MNVEVPRDHVYLNANTLDLAFKHKVDQWIKENCTGRYVLHDDQFWNGGTLTANFDVEVDAVMFQLMLPFY